MYVFGNQTQPTAKRETAALVFGVVKLVVHAAVKPMQLVGSQMPVGEDQSTLTTSPEVPAIRVAFLGDASQVQTGIHDLDGVVVLEVARGHFALGTRVEAQRRPVNTGPSFTSATTTVPPSLAKRSAEARPIPEAAPVISATLFSNRFIVYAPGNKFANLVKRPVESQCALILQVQQLYFDLRIV